MAEQKHHFASLVSSFHISSPPKLSSKRLPEGGLRAHISRPYPWEAFDGWAIGLSCANCRSFGAWLGSVHAWNGASRSGFLFQTLPLKMGFLFKSVQRYQEGMVPARSALRLLEDKSRQFWPSEVHAFPYDMLALRMVSEKRIFLRGHVRMTCFFGKGKQSWMERSLGRCLLLLKHMPNMVERKRGSPYYRAQNDLTHISCIWEEFISCCTAHLLHRHFW